MPPTPDTLQDLQEALQGLYNTLNDAFWVASTVEAKDRIRGLAEAVFDALTKLNRLGIGALTAEYSALKTSIDRMNGKLDGLKRDIDEIIHKMEVASQVAGAIDKAIAAAVKFFL